MQKVESAYILSDVVWVPKTRNPGRVPNIIFDPKTTRPQEAEPRPNLLHFRPQNPDQKYLKS